MLLSHTEVLWYISNNFEVLQTGQDELSFTSEAVLGAETALRPADRPSVAANSYRACIWQDSYLLSNPQGVTATYTAAAR
jgi:hypothetical protein